MARAGSVILDAGGVDKAVLLRELVNLAWATQDELRMLPLRDARREIDLRAGDESGPEGKGRHYFEYMDGIRLAADLSGDRVDLTRYRGENFPDVPGEVLVRLLQDRIAQYALKDAGSGLVAREWVRTSARGGHLTETPLEGGLVDAAFQDPNEGHLVRVSGTVVRDDDGQLVVRGWSERTGRVETRVPRDSNVTVRGGTGR